jgi:uncharacterized protein (TIGR02996 family)
MSGTDDEAAFRNAIEASPDDPLPKLIFADWLDERGDARGPRLRWLAAHPVRPVYDALANTWDWWSRPPREPDYYGGQNTDAAILPKSVFARLKGKWKDIWKGYDSYVDALQDLLRAWAECATAGVEPFA